MKARKLLFQFIQLKKVDRILQVAFQILLNQFLIFSIKFQIDELLSFQICFG